MATKHEKVLLSAFKQWPEDSFSAEDLVVACWNEFPEDFGLQGFERIYPDSNIVYRYIMGQSSIVKKQKWLLQTQRKTYRLSTQGVSHALTLLGDGHSGLDSQRVRIKRAREAVLARLLLSRAWMKYQTGEEIVFREACTFWGIIPRSAGEEYRFARKEMTDSFAAAEERISHAEGFNLWISEANCFITRETLSGLRRLDAKLVQTFAEEVAGISGRVIDRGRTRQR